MATSKSNAIPTWGEIQKAITPVMNFGAYDGVLLNNDNTGDMYCVPQIDPVLFNFDDYNDVLYVTISGIVQINSYSQNPCTINLCGCYKPHNYNNNGIVGQYVYNNVMNGKITVVNIICTNLQIVEDDIYGGVNRNIVMFQIKRIDTNDILVFELAACWVSLHPVG